MSHDVFDMGGDAAHSDGGFQDLQDLLQHGLGSGDLSFDGLTDLMVEAGLNPSDLTDDQMDWLMDITGGHPASEAAVDVGGSVDALHHGHHEVRFGAGPCSHCGGYGYTTTGGKHTPCWYCNGTGVAH
jgi:hypothetical protein